MTNTQDKIKSAVVIFKDKMPGAKGKFRAYASERNSNEVDFFTESGLYCIVNVRSKMIKSA